MGASCIPKESFEYLKFNDFLALWEIQSLRWMLEMEETLFGTT